MLYLTYMGEKINKEFEEYQNDLKIREKKLKTIVIFEPNDEIEKALDELKKKQITL